MRLPLKLNRSGWPALVTRLLPSQADPRALLDDDISGDEFSAAVSVLKFGTTFKTTARMRFARTIKAIAALDFEAPPVVLDVGASDGITALDLIRQIDFRKYYVTDLNPEVWFQLEGGRCYFYDAGGNCVLAVSDKWLAYADTAGALPLIGGLASKIISHAPRPDDETSGMNLFNPEIRSVQNVATMRFDMFRPWDRERAYLVVAANVLNRSYFSDRDLTKASLNLVAAMNDRGFLAIVDSRSVEKSSIFQLAASGLVVTHEVNGGTEIRDLILDQVASLANRRS